MNGFELIAQGAEARLYKGTYLGREAIVKERFEKKYRHPDLDTCLTKDRLKAEARAIVRAKTAGIMTPALFLVDFERRCIYMEYVRNSIILKNFIRQMISGKSNVNNTIESIGIGIGNLVARLHLNNIVHGDLTSSNILVKNEFQKTDVSIDNKIHIVLDSFVLIDFGLTRIDATLEDRAVDLYVLERSLLSAHPDVPTLFDTIFKNYHKLYTNKSQLKEIIIKYKEVQARGRKRLMIG